MSVTSNTSAVELIAELANLGEHDLATIHAIRLLAAWQGEDGRPSVFPQALAQVLNDLAVLRFSAGDRLAARGALRAAIAADPNHPHAVDNLFAVEDALRELGASIGSNDDLNPELTKLNPWVIDALDMADRLVGFAGKEVL